MTKPQPVAYTVRCAACGYAWIAPRRDSLTRCPICDGAPVPIKTPADARQIGPVPNKEQRPQ